MAIKSPSGTDKYFTATQQREQTVKDIIEKERAATEAKSARLKALRLAKEAEDRAEAERNPSPPPAPKKKKARKVAS
jgi:hypothetical protein